MLQLSACTRLTGLCANVHVASRLACGGGLSLHPCPPCRERNAPTYYPRTPHKHSPPQGQINCWQCPIYRSHLQRQCSAVRAHACSHVTRMHQPARQLCPKPLQDSPAPVTGHTHHRHGAAAGSNQASKRGPVAASLRHCGALPGGQQPQTTTARAALPAAIIRTAHPTHGCLYPIQASMHCQARLYIVVGIKRQRRRGRWRPDHACFLSASILRPQPQPPLPPPQPPPPQPLHQPPQPPPG